MVAGRSWLTIRKKPGRRARASIAGAVRRWLRRSGDLLEHLAEALLDGLGGLDGHSLRDRGQLLGLSRQGLELLARVRGGKLDHLRERLHRDQLACEVECGVGIRARRLA